MIFTANHARLILAGKKTRVSLPIAEATTRSVLEDQSVVRAPRFRKDQTFSVQTRTVRLDEWTGEESTGALDRGDVRVVSVATADLAMITYQGAVCEGFQTRADLFDWWKDRYGHRPEVVLADESAVPVPTPVVVVEFKLVSDGDRYLAPGGGYTRDSSRSVDVDVTEDGRLPLTAVDAETQRRFSEEGWDAFAARRADLARDRRERSLGEQLDSLLRDAHASSMDVRDRARKIQREIELLHRDLEDRAA